MEPKHKSRLTALIGFTLVIMGFAAHADQTCTVTTSGALSCTPAGPTIGCVVTPQGKILCGDKPSVLHLVAVGSQFQSQSAINVTHLAKQLGFRIVPQADGLKVQREPLNEELMQRSLVSSTDIHWRGQRPTSFELLTYAEVADRPETKSG
jgi:hypothetical protein